MLQDHIVSVVYCRNDLDTATLVVAAPQPPNDYPEEFIEAMDFMMKLGYFLTPLELLGRT
jgi:hypothetical protein